MTREEAVARIKDHINIHKYNEQNAVKIFEALDMAIKVLSEPEQRWIPCNEQLPEKKTYVLILADTIAGKMVKVGFIYRDSAGRDCWSTLDEYGKNLFDWQPTHWMPIPEPWKGEDNE